MNKQINIENVLDWYLWTGVDETCGDSVCLKSISENIENVSLFTSSKQSATISEKPKDSTILLQIETVLQNAKDVCKNVSSLDELSQIVKNFEGCNLKNTAASTVFGQGDANARVLFIGEAPGADEDRIGKPFVGRCGKLLDKILQSIHLERDKCFITNVLPWRPPGNRSPTDEEIAICLPFLKKQIELISPDFIVLLGGIALKSVMDNPQSISRTRGKWMEYCLESGKTVQVIATYHPSYLLRNSAQKSKVWADLLRLKKKIDE